MKEFDVNSKEYWDQRFLDNWDEKLGHEQSRYFAEIALECMPKWLQHEARSKQLTVCDWGCAEGDGTEILARMFPSQLLTGVDFSSEAIKVAKERYSHIRFLVEDWVGGEAPEKAFDIVFSSNTLEHFHEPYNVLQRLFKVARKCVIIQIPFREFVRHEEHHYTFQASNLEFAPGNGFVLAHSQVIDSEKRAVSYWPGLQIFLVYAQQEFIEDVKPTLADISIFDERWLELDEKKSRISSLEVEIQDGLTREADLSASLLKLKRDALQMSKTSATRAIEQQRLSEQMERYKYELHQAWHELNQIKSSRGWRYASKLHAARSRWLPDNSRLLNAVKKIYRSGTFLSQSLAYADARKVKRFVGHVRQDGITAAVERTKSYLRRASAFEVVQNEQELLDLRSDTRFSELLRDLRGRDFQGVFIMGSCCMGWHEVFKQRHHHIADYLMERGYLVICAMNSSYDNDYTDSIKRDADKENLFLVNFDNRNMWAAIISLLAVEARAPLFYHLVGTEPGTTLDDIERLKSLGYLFVYDFLDEISKEINPALSDFCLLRHEYILRDEEILLLTSADNLYNKATVYRSKNVICAPNGVRLEDWILEENPPIPDEMKSILAEEKPIIGYYGSFAVWMNYDFIKALSNARPDVIIVMIGYDYDWGKGAFAQSRISELPNVRILPAQKYQNLKYFSRFFEVGLVPFREYELTKSVSPVKMFEYMAQGIPVVASGMQECRKYKSCLNAETAEEFVACVNKALILRGDEEYMAQLRADAESNTWSARGGVIEAAMMDRNPRHSDKLLSIVIPTYNMEALLPRCLDSMLPPSQLDRLEIIIVNDGSKDRSLEIAREYERLYPNTVTVVDKENGGHGSCINTGIAIASGRYFKIVDADDWLDPLDLVRHMVFLENHDADMVVTNYVRTYDNGDGSVVSYSDRLNESEYSADKFYRALMRDTTSTSYMHMHAITYKTDILKRYDVRITEKSFYVDQEYISFPQKYVKNVFYDNGILYRYYIGRPGQSVDPAIVRKREPDNRRVLSNIIKLYEELPDSEIRKEYILNIAFHHSWFYLDHSDDHGFRVELMTWWKREDRRFFTELNNYFRVI
ncbi:glycosyltransferase [Brucella tritici]|uniref:Glycosyltransferase n=1 Tax=Brucella tritici TaxID=94626 RepID=A0A7V7VUZ3_9HYPH|nr:glycosyltransferase [Brucella tritici]KAB2657537.1 glycosyltransferase [Brucella tritici]